MINKSFNIYMDKTPKPRFKIKKKYSNIEYGYRYAQDTENWLYSVNPV